VFDLKSFRKKIKKTQTEVAKEIGIDPGRISRYESGKDRSLIISRLLEKCYPEIIDYTISEPKDLSDLEHKFEMCKLLTEMQSKQIALMEELLNQYRKLSG
jgi:transcriptional regulator with XRE-family HTH domain